MRKENIKQDTADDEDHGDEHDQERTSVQLHDEAHEQEKTVVSHPVQDFPAYVYFRSPQVAKIINENCGFLRLVAELLPERLLRMSSLLGYDDWLV